MQVRAGFQGMLDALLWAKSLSFVDTYRTLFHLAGLFSRQCSLVDSPDLQALLANGRFDMVLSDPTFSPCLLRLAAKL